MIVRFKDSEVIRSKCSSVEGSDDLVQDGVKYVESIVRQLDGKHLVKVYNQDDVLALGVQRTPDIVSYVHPEWIYSIGRYNIDRWEFVGEGNKYLKISSNYVLDLEEIKVVSRKRLPICRDCGELAEIHKEGLCKSCFIKKYTHKHSYSYKPSPRFFGEAPYHFGLEIEIGYNNGLEVANFYKENQNKLYLKYDSSIMHGDEGGCEIVTHPISFMELTKKGSILDKLPKDVIQKREYNGCHIHVSRTAWEDDRHFGLFYKFMEVLAEEGLLEKIGGRKFTQYCNFIKTSKHITSISKEDRLLDGRSMFINTKPVNTVEFRFFGSTTDGTMLRSYVELLNSIIQYTKSHKKFISTSKWVKYLNKYKKKYNELLRVLPELKDIPVTYAKPRVLRKKAGTIGMINLALIYSIITEQKEYLDITSLRYYQGNNIWTFNYKGGSGYEELRPEEIQEVTYIKGH